MIYINDIKMHPYLVKILMNALIYLDEKDLTKSCYLEAEKYVEQDIRFVASGNITDKLLKRNYIQFHYTDQ